MQPTTILKAEERSCHSFWRHHLQIALLSQMLERNGLQAGMHLTVKRSLSPRKSADSTTIPTTFTMPALTTS